MTGESDRRAVGSFEWVQIVTRIDFDESPEITDTNGKPFKRPAGKSLKGIAFRVGYWCNADGSRAFLGPARIAASCEVDYKTAKLVLRTLCAYKLLTLVQRGGGVTTAERESNGGEYRLTIPHNLAEIAKFRTPEEMEAEIEAIKEKNRNKSGGKRSPRESRGTVGPVSDPAGDGVTGQSVPDEGGSRGNGGGSHGAMASAIPTQYQPEENQTNPSSLSARTSVTAARVPAEDRERDEVTSSEGPNLSVQQRLVIKHGCPPHLSQQVVEFIEATNTIDHLGWWITADRNGTLAAQVQAAIAANTAAGGSDPAPSWVCGTCGDTGWVTTETGSALCGDCTNDGKGRCRLHPTLPAHTCGSCRADRHDPHRQYGALDRQGRTSERGNRRILRNSHDNPDRYDIKL